MHSCTAPNLKSFMQPRKNKGVKDSQERIKELKMLTDLILPMFHMQPPLKSSEVSLDLRADTILDRLPPFVRNKKEVIVCCTSMSQLTPLPSILWEIHRHTVRRYWQVIRTSCCLQL